MHSTHPIFLCVPEIHCNKRQTSTVCSPGTTSVSQAKLLFPLQFFIVKCCGLKYFSWVFFCPHTSVQVCGGSPGQVGWTRVSPQVLGGCWSFNLLCWDLTTSQSHQERKSRDQQHARGNSSFPCPSQSTAGSRAPLETFHRRAEHGAAVGSSSLPFVELQQGVTMPG